MNINEAKTILLLYRPGLVEADDPQITEALLLAKQEAELAHWFAEHCARQEALRGKFRQIAVPAGLKEQIISEQAMPGRKNYWRPRLALAGAVVVVLLAVLAVFLVPRHPSDDTYANYQAAMARVALKGYYLDMTNSDAVQIRGFFAQNKAPADYDLPAGLAKADNVGCVVIGWQDDKVSMICYRSGRPMAPRQASDLWLFVADRTAIPDAPAPGPPQIMNISGLTTACWTQGDKVYLLGLQGPEEAVRKFL